jgi:hypothetical protein
MKSVLQNSEKHILCHRGAETVDTSSAADFIVLFQDWFFKVLSNAEQLSPDLIFRELSEKLQAVNCDDPVGAGFLSGCYVSLQ